jgi:protein SCO1/2
MKNRRNLIWLMIAVALALLAWLAIEMQRAEKQVAEEPFGVPFELVSQTGAPINQTAFQGKSTALFFGYTHCPDVCPTTLFELNDWLKKVDPDAKKLQAFFVTVDPERDTPELLGQYIANVTDRVIGMSGPADKVLDMVKGFRVYFKKVPVDEQKPDGDYTMDHTASIFLLDSKGRFSGTISYGENPEVAVKKLQNLLLK